MLLIIANMIGTGVFTSLGFQLEVLRAGFPLLMLWVVGGVVALCGALAYAELGAALPRSGGEYAILSRGVHPAAGFVGGWVSATIGFAAPTALAAMTFGGYLGALLPGASPRLLALVLVAGLTAAHMASRRSSGTTQVSLTAVKLLLITGFCAAALLFGPAAQPVRFAPAPGDGALIAGRDFAVSLIYVNYAYTGWNAATYITGEIDRPQRTLPRILAGGTLVVLACYLALNATFLRAAPMDAMAGQLNVGAIAARALFGDAGARALTLVLSLLLVSTVSAMTLAGPRVLQAMGEDFPPFRALARTTADGIPAGAVLLQSLVAAAFILTGAFERVLVFSGFLLGLVSFATVATLFVLRWREPALARPYRAWGYPFTPLAYLAVTGWTLVHIVTERPTEAAAGGALVAVGVAAWGGMRRQTGARPT
ncbi:MAG: APC family permease [Gemmatimonadetes bacterium]|nr:APC family permease [Gemmatimonadota bacterium]